MEGLSKGANTPRVKRGLWQFLIEPRQVPAWLLFLAVAFPCGLLLCHRFQSERKTRALWVSETRESPKSLEETRRLRTTLSTTPLGVTEQIEAGAQPL